MAQRARGAARRRGRAAGWRGVAAGMAVTLLGAAEPLGAQGVARTQARCDGQIITDILVRPQPPSYGGIFARNPFLADIVRTFHATTRESVIRRFVLLEPGTPCSPYRRQETERILRAQPFLAQATVTAYPDPSGSGVRVEVVTVDEASFIGSLRLRDYNPYLTSLTLGNSNLNGLGIYALGAWRHDPFYRDAFRARIVDYQFGGRPYHLSLDAARRFQGGLWSAELSQPFLTDVQRAAWRVLTGDEHVFTGISRGEGLNEVAMSSRRSYADVGGILRVGAPARSADRASRLSLFGLSFSREVDRTDFAAVRITRRGLVPDSSPELRGLYGMRRTARANALWGVRDIGFIRVRGFEALDAEQDVRRGFQLGTLFGRSLAVLGSREDDIFVSMDAYAGAGTPRFFTSLQVLGEGRQSYDDNRWDSILAGGRLHSFWRLTDWQTMRMSAEWTGGWRSRVPFQLSLGEQTGGVRGYEYSEIPGGQRGVLRLENRWLLGNVRGTADLGLSLFADAGKVWRGDAPFGETSPVRSSLGFSILAALPPRSQRLWRFDVAFPMEKVEGSKVRIRLFSTRPTPALWQAPDDLLRSLSRTVPGNLFNWP